MAEEDKTVSEEADTHADGWSKFGTPQANANAPPLELEHREPPAGTDAKDVELPRLKRKRKKVRRPRTFSLTMVALAAIGAATIFVFVVKSMKDPPDFVKHAMEIDVEKLLEEDPPPYTPPPDIIDGVLISIEVTPPDARIYLDGKPVQSNPVRVERDRKTPLEFLIWDVGYVAANASVLPSKDKTVSVRLKKAPAGASSKK